MRWRLTRGGAGGCKTNKVVHVDFQTLLELPGGAGHGERRRDYFLKANELLYRFLSLRVLRYHEECDTGRDEHRRLASLVAVRP